VADIVLLQKSISSLLVLICEHFLVCSDNSFSIASDGAIKLN